MSLLFFHFLACPASTLNQDAANTDVYHFCLLFAHKWLAHIKGTIFLKQRQQQSGFTPDRSTLDHIMALNPLAERSHEYRQPLYAAYIDLRDVFDSLDRNSHWNIQKSIGIPPKVTDIIKTLYSSTHRVVRVNGTISEALSISSVVCQGCVPVANLLNTATDRILNNTTQSLVLGVNYDDSGQFIRDLYYADDAVSFDTLRDALFIFNEHFQNLGLRVNWSNIKLHSFSSCIPTPPSTLIGTQPVTTTDIFTYLGSTIASLLLSCSTRNVLPHPGTRLSQGSREQGSSSSRQQRRWVIVHHIRS